MLLYVFVYVREHANFFHTHISFNHVLLKSISVCKLNVWISFCRSLSAQLPVPYLQCKQKLVPGMKSSCSRGRERVAGRRGCSSERLRRCLCGQNRRPAACTQTQREACKKREVSAQASAFDFCASLSMKSCFASSYRERLFFLSLAFSGLI